MVRAGATRAQARGVTALAIGSSDWLARFDRANETIVFAMITDPKPNEVFAILHSQCSESQIHTSGPYIPYFLKMKRRMPRILFQ
jgi:hypothetical protein